MRYLLLIVSMLTLFETQGQSTSRYADTTGLSSYARLATRYKSDYYYMGRADSAKVPYLVTSAGYFHKSGFFVNGSLSYLLAEGNGRVDLLAIGAGYDYFGKKFATGVAVDKYFFNDQSYSVQAEMNAYLSAYAAYDFRVLLLIVDASVGLSDGADVFLGGEISHSFYMLHRKVSLTPAASMNFGTQRYYNEYYTQRSMTTGSGGSGSGHGHGSGSSAGPDSPLMITEARLVGADKFQVLDYEVAFQAAYKVGPLRFFSGITVMFPVNPSTVVTDQYVYEEELDVGMFWTLGLRYLIR